LSYPTTNKHLLNNGLKYNLSYKQRDYIKTLASEAETAISLLPISEQEYVKYQVAINIKHLHKQYNKNKNYNTTIYKKCKEILNQIKETLINNNAIISKSDKVNSMVIIHEDTCHEKVMDFIHKNKFTNTAGDLTKFSRKNPERTSMNVPT
jgi:predicted metal-dependent hydrolase